jgi:hypothetical protein
MNLSLLERTLQFVSREYCGQVEEGASRCGDRNSVMAANVACLEPSGRVRADTGA